jgi:hypothetical protein
MATALVQPHHHDISGPLLAAGWRMDVFDLFRAT